MRILIYGYGNPGRQDDGIGARFTELIDQWSAKENMPHITTDCNYQLNIEDASVIADYDMVIFVDASVVEDIENFRMDTVKPDDASIEFTMHAVSVAYIVDLCNKIYNKTPKTYVLHIKAESFDFIEELTPVAKQNMLAAAEFLKRFLENIHETQKPRGRQ